MTVTILDERDLREPVLMEWDVLAWEGTSPGSARILHVSPDRRTIWILRLDGASWPEGLPYDHAWTMVDEGAWTHTVGEPRTFPPASSLSEKQRDLLAGNWKVVGPLLRDVPAIFDKRRRVALSEEAAIANRCTRRFVMNLLRRAFENGMSRDSVRSTLDRNGTYERTPEMGKTGPKAPEGDPPGPKVDEDMKHFFRNALRLHWARKKRMNLRDAYDLCLRLYFMDLKGDVLDGGTHVYKDRYAVEGAPSYGQFHYWAPKVVDLQALTRRKVKPRVYDLRNRPILKTSNSDIWGPGGRFQIDATVLDIYIRSRRHGRQLIGWPTLYVVIDVFSRYIVGIYIGLEAPSWLGAMMALANCVEDKVEFCREFGLTISADDWLTGFIPSQLLGDRGEIERLVAENMINLSKITVETAAAYMGSWKGIVESCFRTLPAIFRPYTDGYVETDYRERGARDYRADAALDLDDLSQVIVGLVLYHNNHHVLTGLDRHERLTEDEVPSIPRELWHWGKVHLSGRPRQIDPEIFRFGLMPQADVSITESGVLHEGRYYDAPELSPLFEKARRLRKALPGRASYDKRRVDAILVHVRGSEKGFVRAQRICRTSAPYGRSSAWEEHGAKLVDRRIAKAAQRQDQLARADAQGRAEAVNRRAVEKSAEAAAGSVAGQVAGIREARAEELAADRLEESKSFLPDRQIAADINEDVPSPSENGNVVPFRRPASIPDFTSTAPLMTEDYDD